MSFVSQVSPETMYVHGKMQNSDKSPREIRVSRLAQDLFKSIALIVISVSFDFIQRDIEHRIKSIKF